MMNGVAYRLGHNESGPVWEKDNSLPARASHEDVFNKVKRGLEFSVGEPFLLVVPENDFNHYESMENLGPDIKVFNLGVLNSHPVSHRMDMGGDLVSWVSLPTRKYMQNFDSIKHGPMSFNCINPDDLGVSDFRILNNNIHIYSGAEAIENYIGDSLPVGYFKSMNILGKKVTDRFYSTHKKMIERSRHDFCKDLRTTVIKALDSPDSISSGRWKMFRDHSVALGVENRVVNIKNGFYFRVGEYLKNKP